MCSIAPPVTKLFGKFGKQSKILLADSTPATVGMRVVAVGSSVQGRHRVGHKGVIALLQPLSQLLVQWDHSDASQLANCLELIPEHKAPAGLVRKHAQLTPSILIR